MKNQHCELKELGWSDWFEQRAECKPTDTIGIRWVMKRPQCHNIYRSRLACNRLKYLSIHSNGDNGD